MGVLIDTVAVPPEARFEFWCEAQQQLFMPLKVRRSTDGPFWARASGHDLCDIKISRTASEASIVMRTSKTIAELDPETLTVVIQLRGTCVVTQDGRTAECGPGDLAICDSSRPYVSQFVRPIEVLTFALPKSLLRPHLDHICARTAVRVPGDQGRGRPVRSFLRQLVKSIEEGDVGRDDQDFAESVVSLVRGLYSADARYGNGLGENPQAELLLRIKRYIQVNLGEASLDPESIARAHYISRRYLYRLFEAEGAGVQGWIRQQRLERCRRDLRDPGLRHEKILAIATRWGFTSPSHFSRAFHAAYGCLPRDYRDSAVRQSAVAPALSNSERAITGV